MTRCKAFTLVEVMIALAVLAVAITGIASMYFQSERMNRFDADRITCSKLAHQTMENLLSMSVSEIKQYDYRASGMSSYQDKAFTAVNRQAVTVSKDVLGDMDEDDYDQGVPESGASDTTLSESYDPETMTRDTDFSRPTEGTAATKVTVTDLNWSSQYDVVLIEVEVPEFGVKVSAVKTSVSF